MSWPGTHRRRICAACTSPCAAFQARQIAHDDDAAVCPAGHWGAFFRDVAPAPAPQGPPRPATAARPARVTGSRDPAVWGPPLWAELHARPAVCDLAREREWLARFAFRVPCGECRGHWLQLMRATPPDLSSAEAYYAWTVQAHNTVNERLGRPAWGPSCMAPA